MKRATSELVRRLDGLMPETALVLGSGLGGLVSQIDASVHVPYRDLEGFPQGGVSGHAGEIVAGTIAGTPVIALSGRVHYYEHGKADAMRPMLETLKGLGIESLLLTNAAGSLREDMPPGSVMLIEDHINFSGTNPLIGEPNDARFAGMTHAYDAAMGKALGDAADSVGVELHRGVYMWFSGPSFETPAEIRMARMLGADAVGMSTVPEIILCRFLDLRAAACSVITNYGAGMTGGELSHQETKDMAPQGGAKLARIISQAIGALA